MIIAIFLIACRKLLIFIYFILFKLLKEHSIYNKNKIKVKIKSEI